MPLNLNANTQKVIVKPDYKPITYTGYTPTVIVGSGATIATHINGNTWNVYVPVGSVNLTGSGATIVTGSGSNWVIYTPQDIDNYVTIPVYQHYTGTTVPNTYATISSLNQHTGNTGIHRTSGQTQTQINNSLLGYYTSGQTNILLNSKLNKSLFSTYTGTTAPQQFAPMVHYHAQYLTGVTWSQITSKPTWVGSGATVVTFSGNQYRIWSPTVATADWLTLTNRPQWLTGTTLGVFETAHKHAQYLTGITWSQVTSKPNWVGSGATSVTLVGNDYRIYTAPVNISGKLDTTVFQTYTGTTAPLQFAAKVHNHSYTGSTITDKPTFVGSGETVVALVGNTYRIYTPTDLTTTWSTLSGRPAWLTGTTLSAFQLAHSHSQYLTGVTWSQVTSKPNWVGSGNTTVSLVGNNYRIYTPAYTPPTLLASRAVITDMSGNTTTSNTTSTEIAYLFGVTSGVQTQLNGKAPTVHYHPQYLTGVTWSQVTSKPNFVGSGQTVVTLVGNDYRFYTPATDISSKLDKSTFSTYTGTTAPSTYYNKTQINNYTGATNTAIGNRLLTTVFSTYTGTTVPANYYNKTQINNYTGATSTAIGNRLLTTIFSTYTGTTAPSTYYNKTQINNYTGTTSTSIGLKLATSIYSTYTGTTAPATYLGKSAFSTYTGTTAPATYYNKTQINNYTGATSTAIGNKLPTTTFSTYTGTTAPATYYNKTQINSYTGATSTSIGLKLATSIYSTFTGTTAPATYYNKTQINSYTGTTAPSTYYNKTQINSYTGATNTAIGNKLPTTTFSTYTGTTAPATFAPKHPTISGVTTTATLTSTHDGYILQANGTFTITLPNGMTTGYRVDINNIGTGTITLAATGTLNSAGTKIATQYTAATAYHAGSNVWYAFGKLTT